MKTSIEYIYILFSRNCLENLERGSGWKFFYKKNNSITIENQSDETIRSNIALYSIFTFTKRNELTSENGDRRGAKSIRHGCRWPTLEEIENRWIGKMLIGVLSRVKSRLLSFFSTASLSRLDL